MGENPIIRDKLNMSSTIIRTAALMAVFTFVSKLLGFVREMVIAGIFGTSYIVDAYVMAQSIPDMLFGGIFASVGTAYMPTFSEITEKNGNKAGDLFTSRLINTAVVAAALLSAVGIALSANITRLIAPNFSAETMELTSFYLKITFGYMVFTCVSSIFDSYLRYNGSFLHPIIAGYMQNAGVIIIAVVSAYTNHYLFAFGILLGYALRFLYQTAAVRKIGYRHSMSFSLKGEVKQILILAVPVFIGSYVSQINSYVDKTLASGLSEGSVAALNYGHILVAFITGLTTTIIATIIYPKITKAAINGEWDFFNAAADMGINLIMIIAVPFSMGAMVFAGEVVQIVYERGAFDESATALTGTAFFFYACGLAFMALNEFLVQIYYSLKDMKTPIKCASVGVAVNIVLNLSLVGKMAHGGLALATSIAALVNFALLLVFLARKHREVAILKSKSKVLKICVAAAAAVAAAYGTHCFISAAVFMPRILYLGIAVLAACVIYILLLAVFKIDELKLIKGLISRK